MQTTYSPTFGVARRSGSEISLEIALLTLNKILSFSASNPPRNGQGGEAA